MKARQSQTGAASDSGSICSKPTHPALSQTCTPNLNQTVIQNSRSQSAHCTQTNTSTHIHTDVYTHCTIVFPRNYRVIFSILNSISPSQARGSERKKKNLCPSATLPLSLSPSFPPLLLLSSSLLISLSLSLSLSLPFIKLRPLFFLSS